MGQQLANRTMLPAERGSARKPKTVDSLRVAWNMQVLDKHLSSSTPRLKRSRSAGVSLSYPLSDCETESSDCGRSENSSNVSSNHSSYSSIFGETRNRRKSGRVG